MKLAKIKACVDAGLTVYWSNKAYQVIKDSLDQYLIVYDRGGRKENSVGLTHQDGVTMNGRPEDFHIDVDQISFCVDDACNERPTELLPLTPRAVLLGYSIFPEKTTWVGVWSYLGVQLSHEEAHELASDLLVEKGLLTIEQQETIGYTAIEEESSWHAFIL